MRNSKSESFVNTQTAAQNRNSSICATALLEFLSATTWAGIVPSCLSEDLLAQLFLNGRLLSLFAVSHLVFENLRQLACRRTDKELF